jgi:hypothetical protein
VFAENCAHGFTRNMLALRPLGLSLAMLGVAVLALLLVLKAAFAEPDIPAVGLGAGLGANVLTSTFWFLYPTEERVRQAARAYAERLLDSTSAA